MHLLSSKKWFFTATNLNWFKLMENDIYKQIVVDAMAFYVKLKRCKIHAFVIMPNHIHLLMTINPNDIKLFQKDFMSFTAHKSIEMILKQNEELIQCVTSTQKDRKYQFWERRPLWVEINSQYKLNEKLNYIHMNPVHSTKVNCDKQENYKWSSAASYKNNYPYFDFLNLITSYELNDI